MAVCIFILLFSHFHTAKSAVYEFVPNDNLLASNDWRSASCSKTKVVIQNQNKIPVYSYVGSKWELDELVLDDSDIIFGDGSEISDSQFDELDDLEQQVDELEDQESDNCNDYHIHKTDAEIPAWHDIKMWRYLNDSTPSQKLLLHSEMMPSQYDTAYFNPTTAHRVFIDMPVRVGQLISGGYSHSSESILEHLETVEGAMQFYLSEDFDTDDFIDDIILEVFPQVHVMGKECEDKTGCANYLLNSKIEAEICKRADCDGDLPCSNYFRPSGHCCNICGTILYLFEMGGMIKFETSTEFDFVNVREAINTTLTKKAPQGRFSLIKLADWQYQLVLIKDRGDMDFDPIWAKETTEMCQQYLIKEIDNIIEDTVSIVYAVKKTTYKKVVLGLSLFCLISFLVGIAIVGYRKRSNILNWFISERIHLRAIWRDDGDRIQLEMADPLARGSVAGASTTSFENPSFQKLLAREEEKAAMAAVYQSKTPTISYDDKSSITFTNPLFNSGVDTEP